MKKFTIMISVPGWIKNDWGTGERWSLTAEEALTPVQMSILQADMDAAFADDPTAAVEDPKTNPYRWAAHPDNHYWKRSNGDVALFSWQDAHSWSWIYWNNSMSRWEDPQSGEAELLWELLPLERDVVKDDVAFRTRTVRRDGKGLFIRHRKRVYRPVLTYPRTRMVEGMRVKVWLRSTRLEVVSYVGLTDDRNNAWMEEK